MRRGDAGAEIIALAQESGTNLVVVGPRGQAGLERIVLGSVARNVLLGSDASVLVIHQPTESEGDVVHEIPALAKAAHA